MSDLVSTAFSQSAPADERAEALGVLQKAHMPGTSDLMPSPAIQELVEHIQDQYAHQEMALAKSAKIFQFPGRPDKPVGMQSVYLDGLQIFARGDYFERPNPVGYETLRTMVEQTPVLNAVLLTRIRQVQRFAAPQDGGRGSGFLITHRDRLHKLTKSELEQTQLLSRFLTNCGWEFNPRQRRRLKRDTLSQFLAKVVRESLTYDSAPIETEMKVDKKKGFDGFYSVDGSTIRLCTDEGYQGDDEIYAVQAIQGRVVTAYSYDDLIYEPRNPRADVRLAGYGLGETELLIKVVTGFLNAMTYNSKGFDDNSIPKGILHLTGEYDTRDLAAFRRYWNAMVKGVNNAWTLPVMVSKDSDSKAVFERIDAGFDEMHFSKWMTFLVSVICAIYGMSPAEINFDSFSGGNTSPLGGSDTAEKLAASKDSGLRPLMAYLESLLSDYLIADFSDSLVFRWAGLDEVDEAQRLDIRKTILTVNEMRAEEGYEAMEGPIGEAPVNPTLSGIWMQLSRPGGEGDEPSEQENEDAPDQNQDEDMGPGQNNDDTEEDDGPMDGQSGEIGNEDGAFTKAASGLVPFSQAIPEIWRIVG